MFWATGSLSCRCKPNSECWAKHFEVDFYAAVFGNGAISPYSSSFMNYCGGLFILYTSASFPHMKLCKPITNLTLFPWQIFRRTPFFRPTSSDISFYRTACYFQGTESRSFPPYCKEDAPLKHLFSLILLLSGTDNCLDSSPNATNLTFSIQRSIVISLLHLRNHIFLHIQSYSTSNIITILTISLFLEWLWCLVLVDHFCIIIN